MSEKFQRMIDYMNGVVDFNFHNGIKLTEVREDYAECRVDLVPESFNAQGIVHGGLIFAICDVATGFALSGDDRPAVTGGASMNFLRPGLGTYLRAVGEPVKIGRRSAIVEGTVYDDQNRLIAKGTYTYFYTD